MINLELTQEQATELKTLLDESLGDMSAEIADTDNPSFRRSLLQRRQQLAEVASHLTRLVDVDETAAHTPPPALYRELGHPGG